MARRTDIKIYYSRLRSLAVMHYSGEEEWNRALRYWCGWPPPHVRALAARYVNNGTHMHLSDKHFEVCTPAAAAQGVGTRCALPPPSLVCDLASPL